MSIKPTVGRVVLVCDEFGEETCGLVTRVWSDTCINVSVQPYTHGAVANCLTSVTQGEAGTRRSWRWMDYQIAKAAEAAEEVTS